MKLMYINGEFTKGNATEEIEVTNPATEEVFDSPPETGNQPDGHQNKEGEENQEKNFGAVLFIEKEQFGALIEPVTNVERHEIGAGLGVRHLDCRA